MTPNKVTEASMPVTAIRHGDKRANIPTEKLRQRRPRPDDLLSLILEVTGKGKKDKAAKAHTARIVWEPAINNYGGLLLLGLPRDNRPPERQEGPSDMSPTRLTAGTDLL